MGRLGRDFFARATLQVARELLGMRLVRLENGRRLAGIITETEAYVGETDLGCHARAGLTPRTRMLYGPPGIVYVYFTYGMHWLANLITEREGFPAAVLLRAIFPTEGIPQIAARRSPKPRRLWSDGPGKLCRALDIDGRHNGLDSCAPEAEIFIEESGIAIPDSSVTIGPRVGLYTVPEPWKSIPWRFRLLQPRPLLLQGLLAG